MEEAMPVRYWCHMCSLDVSPVMEVDIKCPFCQGGFVEEMTNDNTGSIQGSDPDSGSDQATISLWAPILLGMISNPPSHIRTRRRQPGGEGGGEARNVSENDSDGEFRDLLRRRTRRSSAATRQLLQGLQANYESELENIETGAESGFRHRRRGRERVILINSFNGTVMVQSSNDSNPIRVNSIGDYFVGPSLDVLLQHLMENDPNRYGTPPAKKEAIEALPEVKIQEAFQCSVCLEELEVGTEAKEMPCKHKFHDNCLLPWLELHSSCPVCRYQLPVDETKIENERSRNNGEERETDENVDDGNGSHGRQRRFLLPWPLSSLFSLSPMGDSDSNSASRSSETDQN